MGDDDGLVVIPRTGIEAQLQAALQMVRAEEEWERVLGEGRGTLDVLNVPPAG